LSSTETTRASAARTDSEVSGAPGAAPLASPSGERIRAIRATQVNIPLVAPYRWSVGSFVGLSKPGTPYLRHPAHGGATKFRAGLARLARERDLV
jgi:hypothetical protein